MRLNAYSYYVFSAPTDEIVTGYRQQQGKHFKMRLRDMDEQFDAIETMTRNIEDDFKSTKVVRPCSCLTCVILA